MREMSIRSRLTVYAIAFVAIVVGLSALSADRMSAVEHQARLLDDQTLAVTRLLGDLGLELSGFRLAEVYRSGEDDAARAGRDNQQAAARSAEIDRLVHRYADLVGGETAAADLAEFRRAWTAYADAHAQWLAADPGATDDGPGHSGSGLDRLYSSADAALGRLVALNAAAAAERAAEADAVADQTLLLIRLTAGLAIALALLMMLRVRSTVTEPLGAITRALTRLAAGDRNVDVPERERGDEIGQMAKAFDVFRANALALEEAHQATKAAQEQAQALARHDALTGLPNRRVFAAELEAAISADAQADRFSVLMVDLDRFKQINDLKGHAAGDAVLCEVADRLRRAVGHTDTVARLGGDEFAIIARQAGTTSIPDTIHFARRLLAELNRPIMLEGSATTVGASIGIAFWPGDAGDAEALLRAADIAMYRAKQDGRGTFSFFEQGMDDELRSQAALESDFRTAIRAGDIRPHYQPMMDLRDGGIYGFEVLARWHHPERGWVGPDDFIPIAERAGLISDLTTTILEQACRDAADWDEGLRLSLNVSPVQLKDPSLALRVMEILEREHFAPTRLEIEITESALVGDIEIAKQILTALQGIGIKISLDDFGTGYSSLYHLRQLKFDKVKIDRSFVQSIDEGDSEKIVDAILGLAHSIGMPIVAEGIEDPGVRDRLMAKGCEFGQGFHFGRAMTAERARAFARARRDPLREAV
jgi:diguanylate cyclase (GGDEF)-like protein